MINITSFINKKWEISAEDMQSVFRDSARGPIYRVLNKDSVPVIASKLVTNFDTPELGPAVAAFLMEDLIDNVVRKASKRLKASWSRLVIKEESAWKIREQIYKKVISQVRCGDWDLMIADLKEEGLKPEGVKTFL